jgi:hypothetical protein
MKTHEVAKVLTLLAQALRNGPNVSLEQMRNAGTKQAPNPSTIPVALSALIALSQFDKAQWRAVIDEFGFPIQVRTTESTRDIVGKILRHLEKDESARIKLKQSAQRSKSEISPELMNALNFLLK